MNIKITKIYVVKLLPSANIFVNYFVIRNYVNHFSTVTRRNGVHLNFNLPAVDVE